MSKKRGSSSWWAGVALLSGVLLACTTGGYSNAPGDGGSGARGGSSSGGTGGGMGEAGTGAVPVTLPSCGDLPDCGGDPEGEWQVDSGCLNVLASPYTDAGCEDALADATVDASGSYTFLEGTLTYDLDLTVHRTLSISDACASATAGSSVSAAAACPSLERNYQTARGVDEAACTVEDERCVCTLTFVPQHQLGSTIIEVRGSKILDTNGMPTSFCVEGDALTLYFADASDPPAPGDTGVLLRLSRR